MFILIGGLCACCVLNSSERLIMKGSSHINDLIPSYPWSSVFSFADFFVRKRKQFIQQIFEPLLWKRYSSNCRVSSSEQSKSNPCLELVL